VIERLYEEFRRLVKTEVSLPSEETALGLLFGLVAGGRGTLIGDRPGSPASERGRRAPTAG
jgi:hypothetical protein